MKTMRRLFLILLLAHAVFAQVQFQTRSTTKVGPGVIHKHIVAPEKLWNLNVLEIDLKNPWLKMETVKGLDSYIGRETTSLMSARRSFEGHQVIGAVNGDFFDSNGAPINVQVIDGQMLKNPTNASTLGFDLQNRPILPRVVFSGQVITQTGSYLIDGVNKAREANHTVLYNSLFGANTNTNEWGLEILLTPLSEWIVNDTVSCRVEKIESYKGKMAMAANQAVLSAHGAAISFFENNIKTGNTIKLVLQLSPSLRRLKEMIGGWPRMINNGKNYVQQGYEEENGPSNVFAVHPRTAAGFNADSSKLFLVTVDGRRPGFYEGMYLTDLADFMVSIGVAYGINLDGGGSTTMVVRGDVKNHPSDAAGERAVGNALLAVSTAPKGSFSYLQIEPDNLLLAAGDTAKFTASCWDQFFNPLEFDLSEVAFAADSSLGTVSNDGVFIAGRSGGAGYVFSQYQGSIDSAYIQISTGTILEENVQRSLPQSIALYQNYPNPFNPLTTIGFETNHAGMATLIVYDLLGRRIAELLNSNLDAGFHQVKWQVDDLASGVYIYRLQTLTQALNRKMILLK